MKEKKSPNANLSVSENLDEFNISWATGGETSMCSAV